MVLHYSSSYRNPLENHVASSNLLSMTDQLLDKNKYKTNFLTSRKKKRVIRKANRTKLAVTKHGRKYGYSFQNVPPKILGKRSCGWDKEPPNKGL